MSVKFILKNNELCQSRKDALNQEQNIGEKLQILNTVSKTKTEIYQWEGSEVVLDWTR